MLAPIMSSLDEIYCTGTLKNFDILMIWRYFLLMTQLRALGKVKEAQLVEKSQLVSKMVQAGEKIDQRQKEFQSRHLRSKTRKLNRKEHFGVPSSISKVNYEGDKNILSMVAFTLTFQPTLFVRRSIGRSVGQSRFTFFSLTSLLQPK